MYTRIIHKLIFKSPPTLGGGVSIQAAGEYLQTIRGGRGILLAGIAGVPSATVVIIGGGVMGFSAARTASDLGSQVVVLDVDTKRLRFIEDYFKKKVTTLYSNKFNIERCATFADCLIGAIMVPGARTPHLVTEDMVGRMRERARSINQGGCVETSRPTTLIDPVFTYKNIIHYYRIRDCRTPWQVG